MLNESNNFSLPQHLQVAGNATVAGNAVISGTATISSNATIGGSASVSGSTNLYGATTTHSSFNANAGINVGSGQTINNPGTMHIEAAGNLYLKPWTGGGQVVVGGGGGNGNLHATGRVTANGSHAITAQSNDWAFMARDAGGGLINAPRNSAGSMHVNDIYVRSAGKWASDMGGGVPSNCQLFNSGLPAPGPTNTAHTVQCPNGWIMKGMRFAFWSGYMDWPTDVLCCQ